MGSWLQLCTFVWTVCAMDKDNELSEMYNVAASILNSCNLRQKNKSFSLQSMLLSMDVDRIFNISQMSQSAICGFTGLIQSNYSTALDVDFLTIFRAANQAQNDCIFILFTYWLQIKLNSNTFSLLNSATSSEIISIIIKSIKFSNVRHYENILKPLWRNFIAPNLFKKLTLCQKKKNDKLFIANQCHLNQIIAAYLCVFCSGPKLRGSFAKMAAKTDGIIVLQSAFYKIVSSEQTVSLKVRRRYFEIWFYDQRINLLNHAYFDGNYGNNGNAQMVSCFLRSLIASNKNKSKIHRDAAADNKTEIEKYLHYAFVKDKMLRFHFIKNRNRMPIYGQYITVDSLKKIVFTAHESMKECLFHQFVKNIWDFCDEFERNGLLKTLELR